MIESKIIADSLNVANSQRITSYIWTYPRYIHSEIMTHRSLSKNSASSRAIPVGKLIEMVKNDPAMPSVWPRNHKGMMANEYFSGEEAEVARREWLTARDHALKSATELMSLNVHKQIANRVLEPWMNITVIVTGTEWENFFGLRCAKDAHPDFMLLAHKALGQYLTSEPKELVPNEWHIPFNEELEAFHDPLDKLKIATARCARISYLNFDGKRDFMKDFELHDKLLESKHMSPFEHCAMAIPDLRWSGNFYGWTQYRKMFPEKKYDLKSVYEEGTKIIMERMNPAPIKGVDTTVM